MQRVLEALNIRPALQAMIMQDVCLSLYLPFPSPLSFSTRIISLDSLLTHLPISQHPNLPLQSIPDLRKLWDWSLVKVRPSPLA